MGRGNVNNGEACSPESSSLQTCRRSNAPALMVLHLWEGVCGAVRLFRLFSRVLYGSPLSLATVSCKGQEKRPARRMKYLKGHTAFISQAAALWEQQLSADLRTIIRTPAHLCLVITVQTHMTHLARIFCTAGFYRYLYVHLSNPALLCWSFDWAILTMT